MTELKRGNVDREGAVEEGEGFGAGLDCGDGATDEGFLVRLGEMGASVAREDVFAWSDKTAVGTPKIINDGWNDAIMHVAGNEEIEFVKIARDFGVGKEDGRMNERDFDFALGEILDEFMIELVEVVEHDVFVFAARMKDGSRAIFVAVELEVFWRLSKTENVDLLVFVGGIVENLDVVDSVNGFDELLRAAFVPVALAGKHAGKIWVFVIKIVVAENDEDRGDFAETSEPGNEATSFGFGIDVIERIDQIASDKNIMRLELFGLSDDGA